MSSKLKARKKKMQPAGYTKKNLIKMRDMAIRERNTESLVDDAVWNIQLIAFQILHDKFGFGQKRMIRIEKAIKGYGDNADLESTKEKLDYLEKHNIDTKEEANKVPFRERFVLTKYEIGPESQQAAGYYLLATTYTYFSMLGYCLKTEFKFSVRQIKEVYEWIRYYINTLSRRKQFDLTIEDIAETLAVECKYCDSRFVGKFKEKGLI